MIAAHAPLWVERRFAYALSVLCLHEIREEITRARNRSHAMISIRRALAAYLRQPDPCTGIVASLPEIGAVLRPGRSHTSILDAIRACPHDARAMELLAQLNAAEGLHHQQPNQRTPTLEPASRRLGMVPWAHGRGISGP